MNKKHRRYIKRLACRNEIDLFEAIKLFYGEKEISDKNILYSICKKRNKGKVGKLKALKRKNNRKLKNKVLSKRSECDNIDLCQMLQRY